MAMRTPGFEEAVFIGSGIFLIERYHVSNRRGCNIAGNIGNTTVVSRFHFAWIEKKHVLLSATDKS